MNADMNGYHSVVLELSDNGERVDMPGFMSMGSCIGLAVAQEAWRMVHFRQPPGPLLLRLPGLQKVQHLPSARTIRRSSSPVAAFGLHCDRGHAAEAFQAD